MENIQAIINAYESVKNSGLESIKAETKKLLLGMLFVPAATLQMHDFTYTDKMYDRHLNDVFVFIEEDKEISLLAKALRFEVSLGYLESVIDEITMKDIYDFIGDDEGTDAEHKRISREVSSVLCRFRHKSEDEFI